MEDAASFMDIFAWCKILCSLSGVMDDANDSQSAGISVFR